MIEADAIGVELVDPISWDIETPIRPGVDFVDGVVYYTLPATVTIQKPAKRKGEAPTLEKIRDLVAVTSDGRQFHYTKEEVEKRGYAWPDKVTRFSENRWNGDGIRSFLMGEALPPDPATLHQAIKEVYETYIEFADERTYDLMPLYVMASYMFRLFKSIGYIHFNGTAGSGKSQNLRILDALGFNTIWSANISAAALFRTLTGFPGITLIDEAEGFEGERGEELRRLLNAGYLEGESVLRTEKGANDQFQISQFEVFSPKVIASINPLDSVLGQRCLVILMRPAIRKIPEFDHRDPRWARMRDRLYLWGMYHTVPLNELLTEWNEGINGEEALRFTRAPALVNRQWQVTQLYVVLADYIDRLSGTNLCDRLIEYFNEYYAELQRQQNATDRIRIVLQCLPRVLAQHFPAEGGYFHLKTIHQVVSEYLEEDSKEFYKTRNLSKHLDVLGFKNKRPHKQGVQIWLDPAQIRREFAQRRVTPFPEDEAWLRGEVEYKHAVPDPETASAKPPVYDIWSTGEEEEEP